MERSSSLALSFLLIVSLFAPFSAMASETPSPAASAAGTTAASCHISNLNTTSLDYKQSTAIQGIVQQDVATSAENYRRQAALKKLGVDTRGDRAKLADKYNFYFMGADGPVYYYDVLDDIMKPSNGYLIGTDIDGRIEYGGHLHENLAMCGQTPVNSTGNVCNSNADIDKTDTYMQELKKAKTKADLMSAFVSLEGMGELAPSDVLHLGQSRLMMTEYTTTMATSGPGSTIFVLPQALVMYTAAMKKLDMVDLVVGIIGAGASMRAARTVASEGGIQRTKMFKWFSDAIHGRSSMSEAAEESARFSRISRFGDSMDSMKSEFRAVRNAVKEQNPAYNKNLGLLIDEADDQIKGLKSVEGKLIGGTKEYEAVSGKIKSLEKLKADLYTIRSNAHNMPPGVWKDAADSLEAASSGSKDIESIASKVNLERNTFKAMKEAIANSRTATRLRLFKSALSAENGGLGKALKVLFTGNGVTGENIAFSTAKALLYRLSYAIYAGPGTKAIMIARGLHAANDLLLREGFLELTGAGLSLHYSKDELGKYYTDESVVVLLAQNSLVHGLMSAYLGGDLGATFFGILGQVNQNIQPLVSKANLLGDVLVFGGIMYPPKGGVIEVTKANPKGMTEIDKKGGYYIMHIRNWDNHVYSAVEDVRTMKRRSAEGTLVTAMGMWTNKIDLYGHMYSQSELPGGLFTGADTFIKKIGNWGVFSNLLIASSSYYLFFTRGSPAAASLGMGVLGAPLGLYLSSQHSMLAGKDFMTAQYTDMKSLSECIRTGNTSGNMSCNPRQECAPLLSECFSEEGMGSAEMIGTTVADMALASSPALGPVGAGVMLAEVAFSIQKIKVREQCLRDLATCKEHTFTIIGAAQYTDPAIIAEKQQSEQLKALPGLDQLPINDFLSKSGLGNITNPTEQFSQQQLNVHTEGYNVSGRMAFDQLYYAHLQDASIQWVEGKLPINLCSLDDAGNPQDDKCLTVNGQSLVVGGKTVMTGELVPFKWMDTDMPALVIPNTAVTITLPSSDCMLFSVDKTGTHLQLSKDVVAKFEAEGFDEVGRMMGTMRVINTDKGSIYPSVDYNGDFRLERDKPDGSFGYSTKGVTVTANAKVKFNGNTLGFQSAVFTGGSIIKKGDRIYVLPKYFMPEMSGKSWLQHTQGTPFKSATGNEIAALDSKGNLIGIDAAQTRLPGGKKLGILTKLDAWKDTNGDGKVQAGEKAGWRFYTGADNKTKFELAYNGKKEVYDADQVAIDKKTGAIKVYEKGKPHVEANLLRTLETRVDSLGRTLFSIKDGQGNTLLDEALVTYLKGTGGAIRYNPDNNNYIFVNGQPVELNNDFKLNGFNPITGRTDPPLLQPSSVSSEVKPYEKEKAAPPAVPLHGTGAEAAAYVLALFAGIYLIYRRK